VQPAISRPFNFTVQILQVPSGSKCLKWHKVGIKTPFCFAASIKFNPFSAVQIHPSILNEIFFIGNFFSS
jgi:hypothetical protein